MVWIHFQGLDLYSVFIYRSCTASHNDRYRIYCR